MNGEKVVRALERAGLVFRRQTGGHRILRHPETKASVSVPIHGSKDLKPGTLHRIIRQAGLTVDEFRRLLK